VVEVELSFLLCVVLDSQTLIPYTNPSHLVVLTHTKLLFPFGLSVARIAVDLLPHSTECPGTGHQVVALVFLGVLAVIHSCLLQAPVVVFATRAQKQLLLVAREGFARVLLAHVLLLLPLEHPQSVQLPL